MINERDRYSSSRTWLEELVKKEVDAILKGPFADEVKAAQASFRKQVDELLTSKIVEGLRAALGLGK